MKQLVTRDKQPLYLSKNILSQSRGALALVKYAWLVKSPNRIRQETIETDVRNRRLDATAIHEFRLD